MEITYLYGGVILSDEQTVEIETSNPYKDAVAYAKKMRNNKPYAFMIGDESAVNYLPCCKVKAIRDIEVCKENATLLHNIIQYENTGAIVESVDGYRLTKPFRSIDKLLDKHGNIVDTGKNYPVDENKRHRLYLDHAIKFSYFYMDKDDEFASAIKDTYQDVQEPKEYECDTTEKVELRCCLCENNTEIDVVVPHGWKHRYGFPEVDAFLCPRHSDIIPWINGNCDSCVSGWWDNSCPLYHSFAFVGKNHPAEIKESEIETIANGVCPFRVNGSFSFSIERGIEDMDSSTPEAGAGEKLARYISEYIKKYGSEDA